MATAFPRLDEANLKAICDILGDTGSGLTGSEISKYLRERNIPDPYPGITKRHRLYEALARQQRADACANNASVTRWTYREESIYLSYDRTSVDRIGLTTYSLM